MSDGKEKSNKKVKSKKNFTPSDNYFPENQSTPVSSQDEDLDGKDDFSVASIQDVNAERIAKEDQLREDAEFNVKKRRKSPGRKF